MMFASGPAVVLGVGNILLRDDGVGVRVVEGLQAMSAIEPWTLPADTRLLDGGTLGLDLLRTVHGARSLLLLDAVDLGQPAGTVSVLRGDALVAAGSRGGSDRAGAVGELLAVARLMGWLPDPVSLVGIQVSDTTFGVGLSPQVAAAVSHAVDAACLELRALDELAAADQRPEKPVIRRHHEEEATA
jgi:hydrogenase maturation protease